MKVLEDGRVIGFIKLKETSRKNLAGLQSYGVSLDFGTSSTILYRSLSGALAQPLGTVSDNSISLAASNIIGVPIIGFSIAERSLYLTKYFLQNIEMPFATLLHDYNRDDGSNERMQYRDAHIYFRKLLKQKQKVLDPSEVISDLKWAIGQNPEHVPTFMRDLFGIVLLDAVSNGLQSLQNLIIKMSYPDAIPEAIRKTYHNVVNKAIADATSEYTNFTVGKPNTQEFMTESEVAGRFFIDFARKNRNTPMRLCVIDIGGGTSDIYYTETYDGDGKTTVHAIESSLRIGARHVLIDALFKITLRNIDNNLRSQYLFNLLKSANLLFDDELNDGRRNAPLLCSAPCQVVITGQSPVL